MRSIILCLVYFRVGQNARRFKDLKQDCVFLIESCVETSKKSQNGVIFTTQKYVDKNDKKKTTRRFSTYIQNKQ